ncbi:MAG TPA: dihydropteroate synthase [Terriglobales bacterium]|jgi:dihydropteroate synthase|nr:dihydropteroate synthase [Terriglobales bacterium]
MRPHYQWKLGDRCLELGARTLIMGVVNVTPDSFSDTGRHFSPEHAIGHALRLLYEGADILDIGGESTRPGAKVGEAGVSAAEELDRVLPVIEAIRKQSRSALISIDTYKAEVARACVQAGAEIVNDVSAARWDSAMLRALAELQCGVVLMHSRGRPEDWRTLPRLSGDTMLELVGRELNEWSTALVNAGVECERIVLDPGFGFGKNFEENYPLLARLGQLHALGFPLLTGTSRKSFIGRTLADHGPTGEKKDAPPDERLYGTLATVVAAILGGAHIVRVHDVKPAIDAARVADAILAANA